MSWHQIGENRRCEGRADLGATDRFGRSKTRRCSSLLWVGSWFYLHESKAYCEPCASTLLNIEPRRR